MSVGALLAALGSGALTALATPQGLAQTVGPPVIDDRAGQRPAPDATVLLLGVSGVADVERAALAGAAAVVIRAPGDAGAPLIRAAERFGVSLLVAGAAVPWGELYAMIRTLFTVYEPSEPGEGDLFALADRVARETGGAVAIEDMSMRVVAYSSVDGQDIDELRLAGILGRRVPEHAVQAEEYLAVLRAEGATWCLEPREYAPRLAIGVHAYEQAYGTIWIVQGEQALSSLAPEILAEAATQAVPELARIALAGDAVRRLRNDRVTRLVHGIGPVDPIGLELGLPVGCDFRVIAFGASGQPVDELEMSAASDLVRNAFASYRVQAAVAMVAGRGIALVAGESHAPLVDVLLAEALERASARRGTVWRAGVSRAVARLERVPDGAAQATEVLEVLGVMGDDAPRIAHHAEVAAELFFFRLGTCSRMDSFLEADPIARVLAHDREHATEYEKTLLAWTATNCDVPAAAERLFLHPNTMRHRLGRIRAIVALDDPDTRLVLATQLRMRRHGARGAGSVGGA